MDKSQSRNCCRRRQMRSYKYIPSRQLRGVYSGRRSNCFVLFFAIVAIVSVFVVIVVTDRTPPPPRSPPPYLPPPSSAPRILVLGDSWAERADLNEYCIGAGVVVNQGVSSTTASDWGGGNNTACPARGNASCDLLELAKKQFSHIWLSVGGNDKLDSSGCGMSSVEVQKRVVAVILRLRSAFPSSIKIITTGYCAPLDLSDDCDNASNVYDGTNRAIKDACEMTNATFIDSWRACGAVSINDWSNASSGTHTDNIHVNALGYCRVFGASEFQRALSCDGSVSCDAPPH